MKEKLKNLRARHQEITDEILAMAEDAEHFDDEKQAKYDALIADAESVQKQIVNLEAAIRQKNLAQDKAENEVSKPVIRDQIDMEPALPKQQESPKIPANVKQGSVLKAFNDDLTAYQFGQWIRACNGISSARKFCQTYGVPVSLHQEGVNSQGGYLVPMQFESTIIKLVNEYGIFRQNSRIRTMTSDTLGIPRRTGGLTAYPAGEGSAGTQSTASWDWVNLVARKWMVLALMTSELSEDAIINVADDLMWEIGYAFAVAEDSSGFIGDGTSTYHGITGVSPALYAAAGSPTTTSAGGVIVGAGNLVSELTLANHNSVVAVCPAYAKPGAKWYCSSWYFDGVMSKLAYAAGGNTKSDIMGGTSRQFLGYPVETTESLPTSDSNTQIACLFGSLSMATSFGDRRMVTMSFSDSATVGTTNSFESDCIAVKGTERFDINCHNVGSTTAAGPIVGLLTAAS
jgi:HK97 family phage major capsid protein